MSRRTLFQQLLAFATIIAVLFLSGGAFAQGNRDAAFERAKEVQERHTEKLMAKEGVVGTAIGLDDGGNAVVLVLLKHGKPEGIPGQLDGVKVKKIVTGEFHARDDTARYGRPVPIGVSTGHPDVTAGTIGCRVKDNAGNVYALSNNHVYANGNLASIGDTVLQPGAYDGGTSPGDDIGTLFQFEPIVFSAGARNKIDAAIAATTVDDVGTATPSGMQPSFETVPATIGLAVKKRGRTTLLTTGQVYAVNASVRVGYGSLGVARFVNQIVITPGTFSDGGDSGSLIVTQSDNKAVALLFAGSSSYTIGNPIDAVLDRFGVTIDDGSGSTIDPPLADFSGTPTSGDVPLAVQFTDSSTESPTSWSWDFGDGGASTAQNPLHTYTAAGTYTVSLTATNAGGSSTETKVGYITANAVAGTPPIADFSGTPTSGDAALTVQFTDASTGSPTSWLWDFGDGHTSDLQNPPHEYTAPGSYTVSLTATNADGSDTVRKTDYIEVSDPGAGPTTASVTSVSYATEGGRNQDRHLLITLAVEDDHTNPVAGAIVDADVFRNGNPYASQSGTTGSDGTVTFKFANAPAGTYTTIVTNVTASGLSWDGATPPNSFDK
jgi:PKD repeat protein